MRLKGHIALCTGGNGIIGSGIVRVYLDEGAHVIAPVRSEKAKEELLEEVLPGLDESLINNLEVIVGDYSTPEGMNELATKIQTSVGGQQQLDHVVSCFGGGFKSGPISTLQPEDLHTALDRAVPHLLLSHAFIPLLKQQPASSYILITGMLGEVCHMPNVAALTVANATIYGVIRALEGENREKPFRINELRIAALIKKENKSGHPFATGARAYSNRLIGRYAADVAAGQDKSDQIIRIRAEDLESRAQGE